MDFGKYTFSNFVGYLFQNLIVQVFVSILCPWALELLQIFKRFLKDVPQNLAKTWVFCRFLQVNPQMHVFKDGVKIRSLDFRKPFRNASKINEKR